MRLNPLRLSFPTRRRLRSAFRFVRRLALEPLEERSLLSTYSLWDPTAAPVSPTNPDYQAVEVGLQFKSDVAGAITGIRFYKGEGASGARVGHLWSASGALLASVTFTSETDSGWQEADFSTPVAIDANTTYVASYHADLGQYAADNNYFTTSGVENGPLHALAGANGVYAYGDAASFPTQSYKSTNYWVDVAFAPNAIGPNVSAGPPQSALQGEPVTFAGSATGIGPLAYSWDFGDGTGTTGTLTPTHVYGRLGNYVATLTVTDGLGHKNSDSTSVQIGAAVSGPVITTPYDNIPDFGALPTITAVKSGSWSDPTVWNLGRLPSTGDVVAIGDGTTISYDVASDAHLFTLEVRAGGSLNFRTDVTTRIVVGNFLVLPGGTVTIGTETNPIASNVQADVVIADQALDLVHDPSQYGTGLIVLGKLTAVGANRTPFVQLAAEAHAGDVTLTLAAPAAGWQAGDELLLPDTHQLSDTTRGPTNYVPQWEELVIQSIDPSGTIVTLTTPLQFNHLGARDASGALTFLPQVANRTRNIMFESEDPAGTRGYVMFTYRADVSVVNAGFCNLGRTTIDPEDDTTFLNPNAVDHVGANQYGRFPMYARYLIGPSGGQANGYQFTFKGDVVDDDDPNNNRLWSMVVQSSHYGLVQGNVIYNAAGAGLVMPDGNETGNLVQGNFVMRVSGTGARLDQAYQGDAYWFHGPNNRILDNVATDVNGGGWAIYSYGFDVDATYLGTITVPAFQGADPSQPGQGISLNGNDLPLLEFARDETYGATPGGMTLWWIGTFNDDYYPDARESVVKDFHVWHESFAGFYGYPLNHVTLDGIVVRGDEAALANQYEGVKGISFADYLAHDVLIRNADVQGEALGIEAPVVVGRDPQQENATIVQDSVLINTVNVDVNPPHSTNGNDDLSPKCLELINLTFGHPSTSLAADLFDVQMIYNLTDSTEPNRLVADEVFLYGYRDLGNLQVFYKESAPPTALQVPGLDGFAMPF
jgi:chitodextrinase